MKLAGLSTALVLAVTAAIAQQPSADRGTKRGPSNDPHQIVCIKEAQIGSRLAHRRVCRTRAEWEELHSQLRQALEKAQADKPTNY